ncbi:MAG: NAD(P)-dependent oxidoreductase [Hyphomicrobiaceae bacterium]
MRLAVTGASGFIGRPLVQRLRDDDHTILASDCRPGDGVEGLDLRDRIGVRAWLGQSHADVVIALGAISGPMVAPDDPEQVLDSNIGGLLNLLEGVRRAGIPRLVFISSIAVYATRPDLSPVPETAALASVDTYSASKVAGEAMVAAYAAQFGLSATSLRVSTVYGPGRATPYIIGKLVDSAKSGAVVEVSGRPANMRQYVHVDDVVEAIRLSVAHPLPGHTPINITGGTYTSEVEVAEMITRLLPSARYVVRDCEGGDGAIGPLDITIAERLLGYRPTVSLDEGLGRLVAATA